MHSSARPLYLLVAASRRSNVVCLRRYVGPCEGLPDGIWVGVQYDEPVGKNDGSVKGRRYFACPEGFGGFVRPTAVRVGHYPPLDEDLFGSDDEI